MLSILKHWSVQSRSMFHALRKMCLHLLDWKTAKENRFHIAKLISETTLQARYCSKLQKIRVFRIVSHWWNKVGKCIADADCRLTWWQLLMHKKVFFADFIFTKKLIVIVVWMWQCFSFNSLILAIITFSSSDLQINRKKLMYKNW